MLTVGAPSCQVECCSREAGGRPDATSPAWRAGQGKHGGAAGGSLAGLFPVRSNGHLDGREGPHANDRCEGQHRPVAGAPAAKLAGPVGAVDGQRQRQQHQDAEAEVAVLQAWVWVATGWGGGACQ